MISVFTAFIVISGSLTSNFWAGRAEAPAIRAINAKIFILKIPESLFEVYKYIRARKKKNDSLIKFLCD